MAAPASAETAEIIRRFYDAFARRDAEAMVACYHRDVTFTDPAFGRLDSRRARGMWRMLLGRAADLAVTHADVRASDDGRTGAAHWEARYTFGATGRKVHNVIEARFVFRDGLIAEHVDTFDVWRWSRQAIGPAGLLLGWAPFFRAKLQSQARAQLDKWLEKNPHSL